MTEKGKGYARLDCQHCGAVCLHCGLERIRCVPVYRGILVMKARGIHAPELEPYCGSWVIADRATGKAIIETFDRDTADLAASNGNYVVYTAAQWLGRINGRIS